MVCGAVSIAATRRAGCSTWARVLGVPHIVARFDSNGELGLNEVVHGVCRVGAGLELAAGGAVRVVLGFVLVNPALEKAELVLLCVQAAPLGVKLYFEGHHVLVRHEAVDATVIDDGFRQVICPKVERMIYREH